MRTRYTLTIDSEKYLLQDDDLSNWDEIRCSLKRSDYGGVVRSFSSEFVFVNKARDALLRLYLRDGFGAKASILVETITNRWDWEARFECPLDFSTISWDDHSLSINAVDNSLTALIKANKGTKYEMVVGTDIIPDATFLFNRLSIRNSLTYEITGGTSNEADGSLLTDVPENGRLFCGVVSSDEIYIPGAVMWEDDQTTDEGSYMVEALEPIDLSVDCRFVWDQCYEGSDKNGCYVEMVVLRKDGTAQKLPVAYPQTVQIALAQAKKYKGTFGSVAQLQAQYPAYDSVAHVAHTEYWAEIDGVAWAVEIIRGTDSTASWQSQNMAPDDYRRKTSTLKATVSMNAGDRLALTASGKQARLYENNITLGWTSKGAPCHVASFDPRTVAESLLRRISDNSINPRVEMSGHDPRLAKTVILSAESIRGIANAKLYTSFTDFCDWMSAVFGYVYTTGEEKESPFVLNKRALGGLTYTPYPVNTEPWDDYSGLEPEESDIYYFAHVGKFVAYMGSEGWFDNFPGDSDYNDAATGRPRTDVLFSIKRYKNGSFGTGLYCFDGTDLVEYRGSVSDIGKRFQQIRFVHRSELFTSTLPKKRIPDVKGLKFSVDTNILYSTVTAGYDKKDYENVNGRDEWNFSNTYTTGCSVTDKTLSLVSKYRADCYGIEFAAQKRGSDSTDSSSDQDVFFAYCSKGAGGALVPDTAADVQNAMSDEVFNAVFSPMACIRANAGFIGLMSDSLTLRFASSSGNSSIVIDGEPMNSSIELGPSYATSGVIEFSTDDVDDAIESGELMEVQSQDGTTFRGYLKEVDVKYAMEETAQYKLIVKSIEP